MQVITSMVKLIIHKNFKSLVTSVQTTPLPSPMPCPLQSPLQSYHSQVCAVSIFEHFWQTLILYAIYIVICVGVDDP